MSQQITGICGYGEGEDAALTDSWARCFHLAPVLLENITDVDYRVHGSGLNRPGRNFVFGMTTTF